jgi:ABC-type nickel/cobalt efflux system permease component RcnA
VIIIMKEKDYILKTPISNLPPQGGKERMTSPALALTLLFLLAYFFLFYTPVFAHPMGNFSINHYSKIGVGENSLNLRYIIDMAEIPTFGEMGDVDTNGDMSTSPEEEENYLSRKAEEFQKGLSVELNERPIELIPRSSDMVFIPGAGGLPTIRITIEYVAGLREEDLAVLNTVFYRDDNYKGRAGWKEIVVLGQTGVSIANSSAGSSDISRELSSYPTDALSSLPQDVQARFSFSMRPDSTAIGSKEVENEELSSPLSEANTHRSSFTELISKKKLTAEIVFLSLIIAFALGAVHALSPGHGKTLVAAYLVGSRGTARHALLLGVVVTITHTIGVFTLGFVTLFASKYILPERLYPWLGFASGLIIAVIGMTLFLRRYGALFGGSGEHDHSHSHHDRGHEHRHNHRHEIPERVTFGNLIALGASGGIIPCPEALIVLLSAISLHRIGFGLVLIFAFSVGLALVLMGIGLGMVYARRFMERFSWERKITQWLPLVSSAVIGILGFGIAIQSLVSGGIIQMDLEIAYITPALIGILGLGFILGLKHALDADHVVAVSTIVSEHKSLFKSSLIGAFWGLGHTASLFLIGLFVILLRLTIPPKVAMLMELGVAIMLVVLGANIIWKFFKKEKIHVHTHEHSGILHTHIHHHDSEEEARHPHHFIRFGSKPFLVGMVHGVAGSAALMLLILTTIPSPLAGLLYIVIFGIGSVGGMLIMSSLISLPFVFTANRFAVINERIRAVAGVSSVTFGLFLAWQIGFVKGLFL